MLVDVAFFLLAGNRSHGRDASDASLQEVTGWLGLGRGSFGGPGHCVRPV